VRVPVREVGGLVAGVAVDPERVAFQDRAYQTNAAGGAVIGGLVEIGEGQQGNDEQRDLDMAPGGSRGGIGDGAARLWRSRSRAFRPAPRDMNKAIRRPSAASSSTATWSVLPETEIDRGGFPAFLITSRSYQGVPSAGGRSILTAVRSRQKALPVFRLAYPPSRQTSTISALWGPALR
jgi:hypothetical protein